jgi:Leucine-rich repeat (LRR) protein
MNRRISFISSSLAFALALGCGPRLPADDASSASDSDTSGSTGEGVDESGDESGAGETGPASLCDTLTVVEFADPELEQVVRAALDLPDEPISPEALAALVEVRVENDDFEHDALRSLAGLECAINLERLTWKRGLSVDFEGLEPLVGLDGLRILELWGGLLDELGPLAELEQLEVLSLRGQAITDLGPLAGLEQLEQLELLYNAQLANLEPLAGLSNLRRLDLSHCAIVDLGPLAGLGQLRWLDASTNTVVDLGPLAGLGQLEELYIGGNAIEDLTPLQDLEALTVLDVSLNAITDVTAISTLPALTQLHANVNDIADPGPLRSLPQIKLIELEANAITSLIGLHDAPWQIPGGCADVHLEANPLTEVAIAQEYPQICGSNPNVAIWLAESELCNSMSSCSWPCTPDQPQPWPECP